MVHYVLREHVISKLILTLLKINKENINIELQDYFDMQDIKSVSEFETLINNWCPSESDLTNGIAIEKHIICTIFQDFPEIFQDS